MVKSETDKTQWIYWLGLKSIRGVGNLVFLRLLNHFGSPFKVFQASKAELVSVHGIGEQVASAIVGSSVPDHVKQDLEHVLHNDCAIVTITDKAYPTLLREIHDPPPFLYTYGTLHPGSQNVAVVGSRNATKYGIDVTHRLSMDLASHGMTVVSGMARGIDSAAHWGALAGQGETIGVLGCGLGTVYPAENRKLFQRIGRQGALVSEFPYMVTPEPHHFPIRNRIISGISLGTVIVEATHRSGSLITAQLAAEQGREVFAVPGTVTSFKSVGTHSLIKQGAKLVENVQDILEEFPFASPPPRKLPEEESLADISHAEKKVLDVLSADPTHIDRVVRQLSLAPGDVSGLLLHLEIKGLVTQNPGKQFIRVSPV